VSALGRTTRAIVEIAQDGQIDIPPQLAADMGLAAGAKIVLEANQGELRIHAPVTHLDRVYIEPTNTCNLGCRTCMRNVWDEPLGFMNETTFARILQGLEVFTPPPTVFFGGFGEPLSHPRIVDMIRRVKALGCRTELISNGVYLSPQVAHALAEASLDVLWVSLDGSRPESYADVRLGAEFPQVIENLKYLQRLLIQRHQVHPQLGIAFVAMRRNIADLPAVLRLGSRLGAAYFSISNVLAHTPELAQEKLYDQSMYNGAYQVTTGLPVVSFPRMDAHPQAVAALAEALNTRYKVDLAGAQIATSVNRCPFVEKNSTSIRWDGALSPCLPLLHTHQSFLDQRLRLTHAYSIGDIRQAGLLELWNDPGYLALRERLRDFDFSPCTLCNSCEMPDENLEDCFGNATPACGGCLWAQGIIQCP
jgi:MoaA/NifB/PqqE/SkfB family radical SAM enzyme